MSIDSNHIASHVENFITEMNKRYSEGLCSESVLDDAPLGLIEYCGAVFEKQTQDCIVAQDTFHQLALTPSVRNTKVHFLGSYFCPDRSFAN